MAEKPRKWIAKATSGAHGQFRKKAEAAGETTREFAKEHEHDADKTGQQARLAIVLMGMDHTSKRREQLKKVYTHGR